MPHKHKRDKSKNDASFYDLPPTKTAHPLPVKKLTTTVGKSGTKPAKRKHTQMQDDTPRAFGRLLGDYRPPRSGLDNGTRPFKRARKESNPESKPDSATFLPAPAPVPTIQPREPLSSFAARVDAALPFSGLSKKSGGAKEAGRERQTKTERKMQKMQKEWREEDRRRKEKLEEEGNEDGDENVLDKLLNTVNKGNRKDGKRKRKRSGHGEDTDDDDDPWAYIAAKRLEAKDATTASGSGAGLVGLHDVVLAPPRFSKVPKGKENLSMKKGVGGLKRQQELSEARMTVVEGYRKMMREKRGEGD
ncbi:MAG: hypothetical protein ASARMPREDX12_007192 [Alectoria sarmentosa]|nr:MAG: hypothetical protein ASARMPRED_004712 [Alectoria sarmentosa]CAD6593423.1 MAG: hypothetical protein ASARMPREDX12_007192 [Alectoria sarmentosa]